MLMGQVFLSTFPYTYLPTYLPTYQLTHTYPTVIPNHCQSLRLIIYRHPR